MKRAGVFGITPANPDNRLKGKPDELMFIPGLRIRLTFNAAASWYLLWETLGTSPDGAVPDESNVWAQVLCYSLQTRPSEYL